MASPDISSILSLFQTLLPKPVFDEICQRRYTRFGAGIFNVPVVVWLMILQRLQAQKILLAGRKRFHQICFMRQLQTGSADHEDRALQARPTFSHLTAQLLQHMLGNVDRNLFRQV